MKKIILLSLALLILCNIDAQISAKQSVPSTRVMTFNIRLDHKGDGKNNWQYRKDKAVQTILEYKIVLFGVQEAFHSQMQDLENGLKDYESIGVGREDGMEKGEYSAIFYNTTNFEEMGSGYFWLSEHPMQAGSKGWDAACERIATWAKLKDKRNGKIIFVLNTHFDHVGEVARRESVKLILQKVDTYTRKHNYPVIVMGDFNANPKSEVIREITNKNNDLHLNDSRSLSPTVSGPDWTFHDFGRLETPKREVIDYIFVKNNVRVLNYMITNDTEDDVWISDHCPVVVDMSY